MGIPAFRIGYRTSALQGRVDCYPLMLGEKIWLTDIYAVCPQGIGMWLKSGLCASFKLKIYIFGKGKGLNFTSHLKG